MNFIKNMLINKGYNYDEAANIINEITLKVTKKYNVHEFEYDIEYAYFLDSHRKFEILEKSGYDDLKMLETEITSEIVIELSKIRVKVIDFDVSDIIVWSTLSTLITGKPTSIRKNFIPDKYRDKVESVKAGIEKVLIEIGLIEVSYKKQQNQSDNSLIKSSEGEV